MTDRKQGFSLRKLFPGFNRRVEEIRLRYDFAPERVKELTSDPRVPAPDKLRAWMGDYWVVVSPPENDTDGELWDGGILIDADDEDETQFFLCVEGGRAIAAWRQGADGEFAELSASAPPPTVVEHAQRGWVTVADWFADPSNTVDADEGRDVSFELERFTASFGERELPDELRKLLEFDCRFVQGSYADGFGLYPHTVDDLSSWSEDPEFQAALQPFAVANGSGSMYVFWTIEDDLARCPIVVFGDEGGHQIVAEDLRGLLALLTYDTEVSVGFDDVYYYRDEDDYEESPEREQYLAWLNEQFGIEPVDDPDPIVARAQERYQGRFAEWIERFVPA